MKERPQGCPLSPPTFPPTEQDGESSAKKQGTTRLIWRPPRRPDVTPLYGKSLQKAGWGASRSPARMPQAPFPPCAAPPNPSPPPLHLARRAAVPSRAPRPRPHSPVPEPARPPSAASTRGKSRRSARRPMAGNRLCARRRRRAGGRSAGAAGGGLSSARAAHWVWLGPWAGRGSTCASRSRGRAARNPARLRGAPRPPLRWSPHKPWDRTPSPNSGPGRCHAEGQSGSAQPCLTKGFPNLNEHRNRLELFLIGRL